MEKSYIKKMNQDYLFSLGFTTNQINLIENLINHAIKEKLYTKTKVLYHDLTHIERVLIYVMWILNEKLKNGIKLNNKEILFCASLYHDSGKTIGASEEKHGLVGAKVAYEKLKDKIDDKDLNSIELLIETHAVVDNKVYFRSYEYSVSEKENIQMLSDILKDADALDRNRLKLYPYDMCKIEYLRNNEAKEIYYYTDELYDQYSRAMKLKKSR